jgi:hypothetical protein
LLAATAVAKARPAAASPPDSVRHIRLWSRVRRARRRAHNCARPAAVGLRMSGKNHGACRCCASCTVSSTLLGNGSLQNCGHQARRSASASGFQASSGLPSIATDPANARTRWPARQEETTCRTVRTEHGPDLTRADFEASRSEETSAPCERPTSSHSTRFVKPGKERRLGRQRSAVCPMATARPLSSEANLGASCDPPPAFLRFRTQCIRLGPPCSQSRTRKTDGTPNRGGDDGRLAN